MPNTPTVVLDAVGNVPNIGDRVVFAPAQRGAQEFVKGVIVKVSDKTVTIEHGGWKFDESKRGYVGVDDCLWSSARKSGCFVIVKENV